MRGFTVGAALALGCPLASSSCMPETKAPAYLLEFNTRTRLQNKKISLAAENGIFTGQFAALKRHQHEASSESHAT